MSTVPIPCPGCQRQLHLPLTLIGQTVRCPACKLEFTAPAPAERPPPLAEPAALDRALAQFQPTPMAPPKSAIDRALEQLGPPPARRAEPTNREWDECPVCRASVPPDADRCYQCGQQFEAGYEGDRPWEGPGRTRRDCEPHRGGTVLALGLTSLMLSFVGCCPPLGVLGIVLGIIAVVFARYDLPKMRYGEMDPAGRSNTHAGHVCAIVGFVISFVWVGLLVLSVVLDRF